MPAHMMHLSQSRPRRLRAASSRPSSGRVTTMPRSQGLKRVPRQEGILALDHAGDVRARHEKAHQLATIGREDRHVDLAQLAELLGGSVPGSSCPCGPSWPERPLRPGRHRSWPRVRPRHQSRGASASTTSTRTASAGVSAAGAASAAAATLVGNGVDGVLDLGGGGGHHVGEGVAQLVHALAGEVDLGAQLVGLGVDDGTDTVELVGSGLGAALVGVHGGVPDVIHGVGGHGAALGAGARRPAACRQGCPMRCQRGVPRVKVECLSCSTSLLVLVDELLRRAVVQLTWPRRAARVT